MRRLIRRGLTAAAVFASVVTPLTLLTTQAGAQAVQGAEAISVTGYVVGVPPDNPGAAGLIGGGPATAGGVVLAKGTFALTASLPGDPPGSTRGIIAFPTGTFTVLVTGGNLVWAHSTSPPADSSETCPTSTPPFCPGPASSPPPPVRSRSTPVGPATCRLLAGGGCNLNDAPIFTVIQSHAVGNINLHTP